MKVNHKSKDNYSAKSMEGALGNFFKKNFPDLSSDVVLPHIVNEIMLLVHTYFPKTENMKPGQAFIMGVDKDEKPGCRKTLFETKMATGVVDIVDDEDIKKKQSGVKAKEIKKGKTERIILQSFKQGIVLTNNDIANYLSISPATVGKYIREIEYEKKIVLPTRAVIHDLGPKITHKIWIIKKHCLENKSIKETMHETHHSEKAINRYISDFKRVNLLVEKSETSKMTDAEIAQACKLSLKLTKEYINISKKIMEA